MNELKVVPWSRHGRLSTSMSVGHMHHMHQVHPLHTVRSLHSFHYVRKPQKYRPKAWEFKKMAHNTGTHADKTNRYKNQRNELHNTDHNVTSTEIRSTENKFKNEEQRRAQTEVRGPSAIARSPETGGMTILILPQKHSYFILCNVPHVQQRSVSFLGKRFHIRPSKRLGLFYKTIRPSLFWFLSTQTLALVFLS